MGMVLFSSFVPDSSTGINGEIMSVEATKWLY